MLVNFPSPPAGQQFLNQLLGTLRQAFASAVSQDQAAPRILLTSPNGTIYSLTVDNAGTLSTANFGKTRP
jgi:hypothetical protein